MVSRTKRQDIFRLSTKVLGAYRATIAGLGCRLQGRLTIPGPRRRARFFRRSRMGSKKLAGYRRRTRCAEDTGRIAGQQIDPLRGVAALEAIPNLAIEIPSC